MLSDSIYIANIGVSVQKHAHLQIGGVSVQKHFKSTFRCNVLLWCIKKGHILINIVIRATMNKTTDNFL